MELKIFVASEDAMSGSVMAKQERISPARRGASQVDWHGGMGWGGGRGGG